MKTQTPEEAAKEQMKEEQTKKKLTFDPETGEVVYKTIGSTLSAKELITIAERNGPFPPHWGPNEKIIFDSGVLVGSKWQHSQPPYNAAEEMLKALKSARIAIKLHVDIYFADAALREIESAIKKAEGL